MKSWLPTILLPLLLIGCGKKEHLADCEANEECASNCCKDLNGMKICSDPEDPGDTEWCMDSEICCEYESRVFLGGSYSDWYDNCDCLNGYNSCADMASYFSDSETSIQNATEVSS